jgi:hypothetical protein
MTPLDVMKAVAATLAVTVEAQTAHVRPKSVVFARHVAMYLMRQLPGIPSFPDIGRTFGDRDHTTVLSAINDLAERRRNEPRIHALLERLEQQLGLGEDEDPPTPQYLGEMAVFHEKPRRRSCDFVTDAGKLSRA